MRSDSQDVFPLQAVPPEPPREPRPQRMLIDLTPNTYVDTDVRVISIRGKEQTDELGTRPYIAARARALQDLTIGGHPVPFRMALTNRLNVQRMVLHAIKRMLLGTTVTAKGPVQQFSDRLYLFPRTVSITGPA